MQVLLSLLEMQKRSGEGELQVQGVGGAWVDIAESLADTQAWYGLLELADSLNATELAYIEWAKQCMCLCC